MKRSAAILLLALGLYGCGTTANDNQLAALVHDLHSTDDTTRFKALEQLDKFEPDEEQQREMMKEAASVFPPAKNKWESIPGKIIEAATKKQNPLLIISVKEYYGDYSRSAKTAALKFLSNYPDEKAIQLYVDLLLKYPSEVEYFSAGILEKDHTYKDVIFPRLLELLKVETLDSDVMALLLNYIDAGQLDPANFKKYVPQFMALSKKNRAIVEKQEAQDIDLWEDDAYQSAYFKAGLVADLLGYFKEGNVTAELKAYLTVKNIKLKMFAVNSLIRQDQKLDDEVINSIAADAESRNWFYDNLVSQGKEELFPSNYKTQEAFAESNMVNWLIYPTELGRAPDAIELMKVVETESNDPAEGVVEFYLYRFKSDHPDWQKDGWMAGVAGYFLKKDKPSTNVYGYTFSTFEKWDDKTPDEHVAEIRELLKENYEKQH
ncbi:MAG: hypothetical protein JWO44_1021 [Bacteroidetes bacterium]|nr:hypothetical protein [Bacteroidota bacterium]